jgi:hypothetical protein
MDSDEIVKKAWENLKPSLCAQLFTLSNPASKEALTLWSRDNAKRYREARGNSFHYAVDYPTPEEFEAKVGAVVDGKAAATVTSDELMPCPCCNGTDIESELDDDSRCFGGSWQISCRCGVGCRRNSQAECIAAWNLRPAPAR